jgi:hypothetical protein
MQLKGAQLYPFHPLLLNIQYPLASFDRQARSVQGKPL